MNTIITEVAWLEKLVKGLKTIKEEEFDYRNFVSESDESDCGTTCCAFGWMPKFVPESGVIWRKIGWENEVSISKNPFELFREVNNNHLNFMFYGEELSNVDNFEKFGEGLSSTNLKQVINRIKYCIKLIKNTKDYKDARKQ